jgi:hypothetical protein
MNNLDSAKNEFRVNRQDCSQTQWVNESLPQSLQDGEILLKIDQVAFTANNITYAMIGEQIGYWQFFPTEAGWGIVPTWGFAEVIASQHSEVPIGERFYGFYPMASHLKISAGKVSLLGLLDIAPHRAALPIIYNYYTNTRSDALYTPQSEEIQSVFRPLFTTSFLIDDFLAENNFFEAKNILLTGASSKTALALAFLLQQRKNSQNLAIKVVGFTSSTNAAFVKSLSYYNQVLDYQQVSELDPEETYLIVDFAGNQPLQVAIQKQVQANLKYNCMVGLTHWDQRKAEEKPANKGTVFFAPTQAQKRSQEWGAAGFQARLAEAWQLFSQNANQWLSIEKNVGNAAIEQVYQQTLAGKTLPQKGYMLKMNG